MAVRDFTVKDFSSSKVMFMDASSTFWLWIGNNVHKNEYLRSIKLVDE